MKRTVDLTLGTVLAIASIPVILCLAVVAAFSVGAWPFFVQYRVGHGGCLFRIVKLRTLPRSFPPYSIKNTVELRPRSRFLRFLRERHLDELPQLLLVPLGRMSLVGPRPEMPESEPPDPAYVNRRTRIRQGCTGLWQIGPHRHLLIADTPQYDDFYLQHASLRLDLWVMWRTALNVVGLGSPTSLGGVPRWALGRGLVVQERVAAQEIHVVVEADGRDVRHAL